MPEEGTESYEIIPVTPLKKLEQRIERVEQTGTIPQLQTLINQIIELIRSNQKIVNDVIQANAELRNEISKLPPKIEELTTMMKNFINLVEAAGKEEVSAPSAESLKPLTEYLQKMVDQNQKILESNQSMIEQLDNISRKLRGGTPVSQLLSSYPGIKFKREVSQ
jgi:division protein CdvB (Snf7/Vps24/ESCRT-III family)